MKIIGLLGGMTSESSVEYYRIINETFRERLGGIHSAPCVMWSVDFGEIEPLMKEGKWDTITAILVDRAQKIEKAGAQLLVICTNTMHKLAGAIQEHISIPILSIIDATAEQIKSREFHTVGLLGTRFTMEQEFYKGRLKDEHDIDVLIPTPDEREEIHRVLVEELPVGKLLESSRKKYWQIIHGLVERGAQGIILGCTEIPLLVKQEDGDIPLFDTTYIHSVAAVDRALREDAHVSQ